MGKSPTITSNIAVDQVDPDKFYLSGFVSRTAVNFDQNGSKDAAAELLIGLANDFGPMQSIRIPVPFQTMPSCGDNVEICVTIIRREKS